MTIYWSAFFMSLLIALVLSRRYDNASSKKSKSLLIVVVLLPLFIIALLRWNVGVDVVYGSGYYYHAYEAVDRGMGNIYNYEPGFYTLMLLCRTLGMNLYTFYILVTVLFYFMFVKFISNNINKLPIAIVIFFLSDLYLFTFSTLRQSLGIAFALYPVSIILNGNKYYKDKKWWISVLLAISMHTSVIYLIAISLLSRIKMNKKRILIITFSLLALSPLLKLLVGTIMTHLSYYTKYNGSNMEVKAFSITYFAIPLVFFVISWLRLYKKDEKEDANNSNSLVNFCGLSTVMMANSELLIMPYRIFPLLIPVLIMTASEIVYSFGAVTIRRIIYSSAIIIPLLLLFINQYYILGGSKNYEYKTVFDKSEQVWPDEV